jgi:hypothetical protein
LPSNFPRSDFPGNSPIACRITLPAKRQELCHWAARYRTSKIEGEREARERNSFIGSEKSKQEREPSAIPLTNTDKQARERERKRERKEEGNREFPWREKEERDPHQQYLLQTRTGKMVR